jgi:hypothetical protein
MTTEVRGGVPWPARVAENRPRKRDQVGIAVRDYRAAPLWQGAENARLDELFFLCSHCPARVEIHVRLNVVDGCMPSDLGTGVGRDRGTASPLRRNDTGEE